MSPYYYVSVYGKNEGDGCIAEAQLPETGEDSLDGLSGPSGSEVLVFRRRRVEGSHPIDGGELDVPLGGGAANVGLLRNGDLFLWPEHLITLGVRPMADPDAYEKELEDRMRVTDDEGECEEDPFEEAFEDRRDEACWWTNSPAVEVEVVRSKSNDDEQWERWRSYWASNFIMKEWRTSFGCSVSVGYRCKLCSGDGARSCDMITVYNHVEHHFW
jgi:hypothetical protein